MLSLQDGAIRATIDRTGAGLMAVEGRVGGEWRRLLSPLHEGGPTAFHAIPYANRILDGTFTFLSETYRLKRSGDHAIHGTTHTKPWTVVGEPSSSSVRLAYESVNDPECDFPFPFVAGISYRLEKSSLTVEIGIRNEGEREMPAGFCVHSQFPRAIAGDGDEARFEGNLTRHYPGGCFPTGPAVQFDDGQFSELRSGKIPAGGIDDCFQFVGTARFVYPKSGVTTSVVTSTQVRHAIVWVPEGGEYFAFEPSTMPPDGFNLLARGVEGTGVRVLDPRETLFGRVIFQFGGLD